MRSFLMAQKEQNENDTTHDDQEVTIQEVVDNKAKKKKTQKKIDD